MKLKVVNVSNNANAFGLRSHIFVAEDGQGYTALANDINFQLVGTVIECGDAPLTALTCRGFECPERLSHVADEAFCREAWGNQWRPLTLSMLPVNSVGMFPGKLSRFIVHHHSTEADGSRSTTVVFGSSGEYHKFVWDEDNPRVVLLGRGKLVTTIQLLES